MNMDEAPRETLSDAVRYRHWLHELRNAANCAGISLELARRMLAHGDVERAGEMLEQSEAAWRQCRTLLSSHDQAMRETSRRH